MNKNNKKIYWFVYQETKLNKPYKPIKTQTALGVRAGKYVWVSKSCSHSLYNFYLQVLSSGFF